MSAASLRAATRHVAETGSIDTFKAWQCIGCGRIDGPQNCIGVCRDRKVELVYASELASAEAEVERLRAENLALHAFVRNLAGTMPRSGHWEATYRSMQERAKAVLAQVSVPTPPGAPAPTAPTPEDASRVREA